MNITPKQVLTLAAKYIGYKEKASDKDLYSFEDNAGRGNFTMFQAELDKAKFWNTPKNGYEWCTSFVAWCFWRIAGSEAKDILCLTGPYGASCVSWAKYYGTGEAFHQTAGRRSIFSARQPRRASLPHGNCRKRKRQHVRYHRGQRRKRRQARDAHT